MNVRFIYKNLIFKQKFLIIAKEKNKSKSPLSEEQAEIINNENPLPINQFRCVVDDMLFGKDMIIY